MCHLSTISLSVSTYSLLSSIFIDPSACPPSIHYYTHLPVYLSVIYLPVIHLYQSSIICLLSIYLCIDLSSIIYIYVSSVYCLSLSLYLSFSKLF